MRRLLFQIRRRVIVLRETFHFPRVVEEHFRAELQLDRTLSELEIRVGGVRTVFRSAPDQNQLVTVLGQTLECRAVVETGMDQRVVVVAVIQSHVTVLVIVFFGWIDFQRAAFVDLSVAVVVDVIAELRRIQSCICRRRGSDRAGQLRDFSFLVANHDARAKTALIQAEALLAKVRRVVFIRLPVAIVVLAVAQFDSRKRFTSLHVRRTFPFAVSTLEYAVFRTCAERATARSSDHAERTAALNFDGRFASGRSFRCRRRLASRRGFKRRLTLHARVLPLVAVRIDADLLRAAERTVADARIAVLERADRRTVEFDLDLSRIDRTATHRGFRLRYLDHLGRVHIGRLARREQEQGHQKRNSVLHGKHLRGVKGPRL